jgi:hypothetical protein
MSADVGRTSLDVNKRVHYWQIEVFECFDGRRWMHMDVAGQSIWWARQDPNLQPDRYEREDTVQIR